MFVINGRNIILDHLRRGKTYPMKTSEASNTPNTQKYLADFVKMYRKQKIMIRGLS